MKKLNILLLVFLSLTLITHNVFAQTVVPTKKVTPTITPKVTEESKEIDTIEKIKDLVASKVAELNLVEKRGIVGNVKEKTNTQITITDSRGAQRIIEIDELTKFEATSDKDDFGISDVTAGDTLSFIGLYNKDTERLLARFISVADNIPVTTSGLVIKKDPEEFLITIVTNDGKKKDVSIETSTKTQSFEEDEPLKSGFTKIEIGERVLVVGFNDLKIDNQINASRVVHFIKLPASAKMRELEKQAIEDVPVSSGSAGKLAPITR